MLELVYVPTGLVLLIFAALTLADRGNPHRVTSAIFWLILASIFALGGVMPHWMTGLLVLAMVAIDGAGRISRGSRAEPSKQEQVTHHIAADGDVVFLDHTETWTFTTGETASHTFASMHEIRDGLSRIPGFQLCRHVSRFGTGRVARSDQAAHQAALMRLAVVAESGQRGVVERELVAVDEALGATLADMAQAGHSARHDAPPAASRRGNADFAISCSQHDPVSFYVRRNAPEMTRHT